MTTTKYLLTLEGKFLTAQFQPAVMDEFNTIEEFDDHYAINYRLKRYNQIMDELDNGSNHVGVHLGHTEPDDEEYLEGCEMSSNWIMDTLNKKWGYNSTKMTPTELRDLWSIAEEAEWFDIDLAKQC